MTRLNLLVITLCILCCSVLNLQAVSRINLTHELALTENYDYVTTFSDSLLHFYRIDHDANTFTLKHWTCSPSGEITTPTGVYTYTNSQPWAGTFPELPKYSKNYNHLYIQFKVGISCFVLTVSETNDVRLTSFGYSSNNYNFTLFTPDYIYFSKYNNYPNPMTIHRLNLNTSQEDSLLAMTESWDIQFENIENKYLLIYQCNSDNLQNSYIIDDQLVIHPSSITSYEQYPLNISVMYVKSEIADNVYLAYFNDGLQRDGRYGIIEMNDFNLSFHELYFSSDMLEIPYEHFFEWEIPYGNGRFSCIDLTGYSGNMFSTMQFNGTGFDVDTGFPNLSQFVNPCILLRINPRYGLGISNYDNNSGKYICIDYQNQTITDTTIVMSNEQISYHFKPIFAGDTIYHIFLGSNINSPRYLDILKIVDNTDTADPTQSPDIISHTAYPNPFKDNTTIKISLKQPETLKASIYNLKGQLVKDISNTNTKLLNHELLWDGTTENKTQAATGLYFYKAKTSSGKTISGKLLLQK